MWSKMSNLPYLVVGIFFFQKKSEQLRLYRLTLPDKIVSVITYKS